MVTHEPDIAQFSKSNVVFKDGKIIANNLVKDRKIATEELKKIAQLTPESATV
jgi:ABC-type lipoprotein export system ATPase subunit